jgi:hypothetical protein
VFRKPFAGLAAAKSQGQYIPLLKVRVFSITAIIKVDVKFVDKRFKIRPLFCFLLLLDLGLLDLG